MDIELDCALRGFLLKEVEILDHCLQKKRKKEQLAFIEYSLSSIYNLVKADDEDHMVFCSSHAEAINHLLFSIYLDVSRKTGKNHFVTSVIDEAPSIMAMSRLQEMGAMFELCPVNDKGHVNLELMQKTISPRTALISLSLVNGLTGVIQPIEEIYSLCQDRQIYLHVDASHALGKRNINFRERFCDFLTFNGESLGAPKGTGALFIRKDLHISPLIIGDSEQGGLRAGSYNLSLLGALSKACEIAEKEREEFSIESARLKAFFESEITRRLPTVEVLFRHVKRAPHITALLFPKITGDALLYYLYRKKVFASQGGGNFQKISHILKASNIHTQSALSFSLNRSTTEDELVKACEIIEEGFHFLQKIHGDENG